MGSTDLRRGKNLTPTSASRDKLGISYDFGNNPFVARPNRIRGGQVSPMSGCAKDLNSGSRLCQMDETLVNCLFDSGGAPGNVKLFEQTFDVGFHRPFGNPEFVPDGLIAIAFGNQS